MLGITNLKNHGQFKKGYIKFINLPIAKYIGDETQKSEVTSWHTFRWKDLITEVAAASGIDNAEGGWGRDLSRMVVSRLAEFYYPINFLKTTPLGGYADNPEFIPDTVSSSGEFSLKYQFSAIMPTGQNHSAKFTVQRAWVKDPKEVGSGVYAEVFSDSVQILSQVMNILVARLGRYAKVQAAYNEIPLKNETLDDTATTTPNLTTSYAETFNPINTMSSRDRLKTETTQTGSTQTVTQRSNGVSAKDQADIYKDLPILTAQIVSDIQALLIDPRTINDMIDYGLADGYYIEWGED